ncbi:hypothetical protein AGOR_G00119960 [Albula goreensis]|uniref:Uncharacterized protein n=1 Tax=Albula goreensis TaxID=1534307 RepID=A0A8T3DF77_9TELE|nr:hypothetical protein AGOR_G00119960 [Albula goreensis]
MISRMLRKRETAAMHCMNTMKTLFSVGLETKQSTTFGHGSRSHLKSGSSWNPYSRYWPVMKPTSTAERVTMCATYVRRSEPRSGALFSLLCSSCRSSRSSLFRPSMKSTSVASSSLRSCPFFRCRSFSSARRRYSAWPM